MNVELINYLSSMEMQAREVETQDSRLRSIKESMDNLKKEQFRKPPEEPYTNKPSNGFATKRAVIVGICLFLFYYLLSGTLDVIMLIFVSVGSYFAGKEGSAERVKQAKEQAEAEKKQWEAKMAQYHTRKERIPIELKQLEADSRTASQAKQQAQARLSEMGRKLGLHSDYWSLYALSHIRALLDHGRADTLKEAINRYETEQRQREHNAEMSYYASEQARYERERAEAAQRAAEAAEYQTEYERQQAEHAAAIRKDVSEMERRQREQEWERMWGK